MKQCKYCGKAISNNEYSLMEGFCVECAENAEDNYRETETRDILSEGDFWLGDGEE